MRKLVLVCALACAAAFVVLANPAKASNTRSWVSASGSDAAACTQQAPCLTFAHAISQTNVGGEIDCLSGGDFGPVVISSSITIDCGGGVGAIGVTTPSTSAVNITAMTGTIVLRNLTLNGFGNNASVGVVANGFNGTLIVQHCSIHGFGDHGIEMFVNTGRAQLEISDTSVYSNGLIGVLVDSFTGAIASVVLNRVELNNNAAGGLVFQDSGVVAGTFRQSVAAENGTYGIRVLATGGVYFTVEESSVVANLTAGVRSEASGVNLEVGASTIGGNGTGVNAAAGSVFTFGNNQISANGSNGSFTPGGPGLQ
jgi:hypothetical protein